MPITNEEAKEIAGIILECFDEVLGEYDFGKYPADNYTSFKEVFSTLSLDNDLIEDAMMWKWGHWGKVNYPKAHKDLIQVIEENWNEFAVSDAARDPKSTFIWWKDLFGRSTTYITAAYITHLVHFDEPTPIIDQHNYRAMNALKLGVWKSHTYKKKPSNWQDIESLSQFMTTILPHLPGCDFGMLDRFLMMFGRGHVAR